MGCVQMLRVSQEVFPVKLSHVTAALRLVHVEINERFRRDPPAIETVNAQPFHINLLQCDKRK